MNYLPMDSVNDDNRHHCTRYRPNHQLIRSIHSLRWLMGQTIDQLVMEASYDVIAALYY